MRAAMQLDEYWYHLRSKGADLPGRHLLRMGMAKPTSDGGSSDSDSGCGDLSDAVATYLRLRGDRKGVTFHRAAERSCGYVIDVCGDKALTQYTKADANVFREALIAREMAGSSITRIFGTVRSIINFAASEEIVQPNNPFGKEHYDRTAGVCDRQPIPVEAIRAVQAECYRRDDEMRWRVALVADAGMRLAEAAGLLCDDFVSDDAGVVAVRIAPHPWRGPRTGGSAKVIPLAGSARWAATRILERHGDSGSLSRDATRPIQRRRMLPARA